MAYDTCFLGFKIFGILYLYVQEDVSWLFIWAWLDSCSKAVCMENYSKLLFLASNTWSRRRSFNSAEFSVAQLFHVEIGSLEES